MALSAAALFIDAAPDVQADTAQVAIEVPEGKTRTVRLRDIPQGTVVAVTIEANGKLVIALVSAEELQSGKPQALFRAAVEGRISFTVTAPQSSDYYLVLNNRRGTEPVKTRTTIRAQRTKKSPPKRPRASDA